MNKKILIFGLVFLFFISFSFVNAVDVPAGGVSYWNFSSTTDLWGSNDGTNNGATSVTDFPSFNVSGNSSPNSYNLDGIDDYINIGDDADFSMGKSDNTGNPITISMWLKLSDTSSIQTIIAKDNYYDKREWYIGVGFVNNEMRWYIKDAFNSGKELGQTATMVQAVNAMTKMFGLNEPEKTEVSGGFEVIEIAPVIYEPKPKPKKK